MSQKKFSIGIIVGSLRKASLSLQMAKWIMNFNDLNNYELIPLSNMPIYNEDLETDFPPVEWDNFRQTVKEKDAVLFITPEYNRSVPAILKNAVDVGSAPHGHNVFNRKPAAIISLSVGKMGAFGANHHLRQSLVFLNMPVMQQPEAYIGESEKLFNGDRTILVKSTEDFLNGFLEEFHHWIALHLPNQKY